MIMLKFWKIIVIRNGNWWNWGMHKDCKNVTKHGFMTYTTLSHISFIKSIMQCKFQYCRSIIIKPSRLEKNNCTCPHQVHNVKKFAIPCSYSNTKYKYITNALSKNKPWSSIAKFPCFMSFKFYDKNMFHMQWNTSIHELRQNVVQRF
jgi:hypothetical protein